jgi:hypothetical protein
LICCWSISAIGASTGHAIAIMTVATGVASSADRQDQRRDYSSRASAQVFPLLRFIRR